MSYQMYPHRQYISHGAQAMRSPSGHLAGTGMLHDDYSENHRELNIYTPGIECNAPGTAEEALKRLRTPCYVYKMIDGVKTLIRIEDSQGNVVKKFT